MNYPRYPEYKPSGVEWLGEVPAHWTVAPLKNRLVRNDGGVWGQDFDDEGTIVLRSTEQTVGGGWRVEEPARRRLTATELADALLKNGDLVVTKSSGSSLHIGKTSLVTPEIAEMRCCFSNFMQRLRVGHEASPRFVWYVLNSQVGRAQFDYQSNTTTGLANLSRGIIGALLSTWPIRKEQDAIAAFLDRETARIDVLTAKKQRLIELLAEKRTTLISQAVTKGLNPAAPMKNSGAEWLGEIPAHWKVLRLRFAIKTNPTRWEIIGLEPGAPVSFVPMEAVGEYGGLNLDAEKPIDEIGTGYTYFRDGDVVVAKITPCFENGKGALATGLKNGIAFGTTELHVLRPSESMDRLFLFYLTISQPFREVGASEMYGAGGQKRVPDGFIRDLRPAIPPLDEQRAIAAFLDHETARIDALIAKVKSAIGQLHEYRAALIADAVTGKIDVRSFVKEREVA